MPSFHHFLVSLILFIPLLCYYTCSSYLPLCTLPYHFLSPLLSSPLSLIHWLQFSVFFQFSLVSGCLVAFNSPSVQVQMLFCLLSSGFCLRLCPSRRLLFKCRCSFVFLNLPIASGCIVVFISLSVQVQMLFCSLSIFIVHKKVQRFQILMSYCHLQFDFYLY